jgi:WD40 repeat protein
MRSYINLLICLLLSCSAAGQTGFNIMRTSEEANHGIFYAGYSPDGNYIVTTGSDLNILIWKAETGNIFRTLSGSTKTQKVAAFTPSSEKVASGGDGNIISLWDIKTARVISTFEMKLGNVRALDISPDGKLIAAAGSDRSVRVWDIESKKLLFDLKSHKDEIYSLRFSPDSKTLASAGADRVLILWDAAKGTLIKSAGAGHGLIRDIAFSPDGEFITTCGDDSLIMVNSIPGLTNVRSIESKHSSIQSIAFSSDGKYLISGSSDGFISLINFQSGEILSGSEKLDQTVASVSFRRGKSDFISAGLGSENFYTWTLSEKNSTTALDQLAGQQKELMMEKSVESEMEPPVLAMEKASPPKETKKESRNSKTKSTSTKSFEFEEKVVAGEIEKPRSKIIRLEELYVEGKPAKVLPPDVPVIELFSPFTDAGTAVIDQNSTFIIGRITNAEGTNVILINKKPVKLSEAGVFEYKMALSKGNNPVDIITVNKKGKMNQMTVSIECTAESNSQGDQGSASDGKYYALIIGINDYISNDISDLDKPVKDAEKLYETLSTLYNFDKENITLLRNPTLNNIISSLDELAGKITTSDNLLIFYAGHGYWDAKGKVGYWFPSDATKGSTVNWFRNSTLRDFIGSIQSKHTLVIADACFSGAILKTRDAFAEAPQGVQKLYDLPSRKAMTSGNESQTVSDESTFMKYLVEKLAWNEDKFLPSETLFNSFRPAVMNNSSNMPQYGVIQNVGDEGGDFVFIKR